MKDIKNSKSETKYIEIRNKKVFKEYILGDNGYYIGKIFQDEDGDYLFKPTIFNNANRLGKGKCLKEIAERLIKLNKKDRKDIKKEQ